MKYLVGDSFIGSVNGILFEIVKARQARPLLGLLPDYVLSYGKDQHMSVSEARLEWLVVSGGLNRVNKTAKNPIAQTGTEDAK